MTATPRAPPTWMDTPLVADPTPVSPRGSEPITDPVADGMTSAAPTPITIMPGRMLMYVQVTVAWEICQNPAAIISSPAATVSLVPARRTATEDSGAITTIAAAIGSTRTPAWSAE